MYREKLREKLGSIVLYVSYDSGAGLGDAAEIIIFFYVVDIAPCAYIRTERNRDEAVYTELFESAEHRAVLCRVICEECGSQDQRDPLTRFEILEEALCIIVELSCTMNAGIHASTAGYAVSAVD